MDNNTKMFSYIKITSFFVIFAVVAVCVYVVASAFITAQKTGALHITTNDSKATITISRVDSQAKLVSNSGKADIRLEPGSYQVMASDGNKRAAQLVSVKKNSSTKINLRPKDAPILPSVEGVAFNGFDSLTTIGLLYNQVDLLKLDFFRFKTSSKTVTVDTNSSKLEPHGYNSTAPLTYTFDVSIDSKTYSARVVSSSSENVRLYLYKAGSNNLIFDSYANQEQGE